MQTLSWQKLRFLKFINSFFNPFWRKGEGERLKGGKVVKKVLSINEALFRPFAWKERPLWLYYFSSFTAYLFTPSPLTPFYFPPYSLLLTTSLLTPSLLITYYLLLLSLLLTPSLLPTSLLTPYFLLLLSFLLTTSLLPPSLLITYYFPPCYSSPYYFPPYSFSTFSSNLSTSHCSCWAMVSCPLSSSMASSALRNGLTSRWLSL